MTWADTVYAVWALVALGAAVSVLAAARGWRIGRGQVRRPSVALARLLARGRWVRVVVVLVWIWTGVHLFAR
ncbi:MAG: DUF6186 family protein [Actinomycetota bacterium]|nr:DUF6186 family protein [Actinomycetota bacterium]